MSEHAPFESKPAPRIVYGPGRVAELGSLVTQIGVRRVLLVTDPGVKDAGHAERVVRLLLREGLEVSVFDHVQENPTTGTARECATAARQCACECFVALGGGSAIDAAKAGNFLFTNRGEMADYRGHGKAVQPLLPLVAVPTTAGTGSECQSYAVIADAETHEKMACGDPTALARIALLDPELTRTQPPAVAACTGVDALSHAVESFVSTAANTHSRLFAGEAFRLLSAHVGQWEDGAPGVDALGALQLGAAYAGKAIENSMLGAAHALANPLTACHGIAHGQAVAVMLPSVIRHNAGDPDTAAAYGRFEVPGSEGGPEGLARWWEGLLERLGLARSLGELGIPGDVLPRRAAEAAQQWTGRFNPRLVDEAALLALYRDALSPRDVIA